MDVSGFESFSRIGEGEGEAGLNTLQPVDEGNEGQPEKQKKKGRWNIPAESASRLEDIFRTEKFPSVEMRKMLAAELGATPRQVQVWFQNKRQRTTKGGERIFPPAASRMAVGRRHDLPLSQATPIAVDPTLRQCDLLADESGSGSPVAHASSPGAAAADHAPALVEPALPLWWPPPSGGVVTTHPAHSSWPAPNPLGAATASHNAHLQRLLASTTSAGSESTPSAAAAAVPLASGHAAGSLEGVADGAAAGGTATDGDLSLPSLAALLPSAAAADADTAPTAASAAAASRCVDPPAGVSTLQHMLAAHAQGHPLPCGGPGGGQADGPPHQPTLSQLQQLQQLQPLTLGQLQQLQQHQVPPAGWAAGLPPHKPKRPARPTKPPRTRRETHDGSYGARSEKNPTLGGVAPPPRSHSLSEKQGNDLMDDIFESLFTREMAEECSREAAAARAVTMSIELMHASAAQTNVQSMAQQQAQQQEQVQQFLEEQQRKQHELGQQERRRRRRSRQSREAAKKAKGSATGSATSSADSSPKSSAKAGEKANARKEGGQEQRPDGKGFADSSPKLPTKSSGNGSPPSRLPRSHSAPTLSSLSSLHGSGLPPGLPTLPELTARVSAGRGVRAPDTGQPPCEAAEAAEAAAGSRAPSISSRGSPSSAAVGSADLAGTRSASADSAEQTLPHFSTLPQFALPTGTGALSAASPAEFKAAAAAAAAAYAQPSDQVMHMRMHIRLPAAAPGAATGSTTDTASHSQRGSLLRSGPSIGSGSRSVHGSTTGSSNALQLLDRTQSHASHSPPGTDSPAGSSAGSSARRPRPKFKKGGGAGGGGAESVTTSMSSGGAGGSPGSSAGDEESILSSHLSSYGGSYGGHGANDLMPWSSLSRDFSDNDRGSERASVASEPAGDEPAGKGAGGRRLAGRLAGLCSPRGSADSGSDDGSSGTGRSSIASRDLSTIMKIT